MTTPTRNTRGGPEGRLHASHAQAAALAAGRTLPAREAIVATEPKVVATPADVLPDVDRRTVAVTVSGGAVGTVALIVGGPLAVMVAAGAPDADELLGVSTAALAEAVGGLEPYYPATLLTSPVREIDLDTEPFGPGSVAVDLLDDGAHVATLVVDLVPAAAGDVPSAEPYEPGAFTRLEEDRGDQPRRSLALLHDVEMAVTVELGRTRLSVRELLALAPGSVVELDRSAGSPVDVLVNGKLIARGEVVVIDEEFGIRISEIVGLQTVRCVVEDVSVLSLLGRLVVSLAVVLALMALLARVVRNRAFPGLKRAVVAPGTLEIVARQPMSRSASIVLVRAADRAFVVGVTDAAVSLLAELDPDSIEVEEPAEGAPTMPASLRTLVDAVRDRSVRRA